MRLRRRLSLSLDRVSDTSVVLTAITLLVVTLVPSATLQDANWDLLNYHAYNPAALLSGAWLTHFHPAGVHSFLSPTLDLATWPLATKLPGEIGGLVIGSIQAFALVPISFLTHRLVARGSALGSLAVGITALTGAMFVTEFGTTMGDSLSAIPGLFGLSLVLKNLQKRDQLVGSHNWVLAGTFFGASVGLKLTMSYIFVGVFGVCFILIVLGRLRASIWLGASSLLSALAFNAPWSVFLWLKFGSPTFPWWNGVFEAPRFPANNFEDERFGANDLRSLYDVLSAPFSDPNVTSELRFFDIRWALVWSGIICFVLHTVSTLFGKRLRSWEPHMQLVLVTATFWTSSTLAWAVIFGIQRYAIFLELLAFPLFWALIRIFLPVALPRYICNLFLASVILLVGLSTKPADFGRESSRGKPIIATQDIPELASYSTVILAQKPLAYLYALIRDTPYAHRQVWMSEAFNDVDLAIGKNRLSSERIAVISYETGIGDVERVASSFGLVVVRCESVPTPLRTTLNHDDLLICDVTRAES